MSETSVLDQKIGSAFQVCIEKLADRLLDNFNANDNESLSLFRLFCNAVRARFQWLKKLVDEVFPPLKPAARADRGSSQKKSNGGKQEAGKMEAGKMDDAQIDDALKDLNLNGAQSQSPLRPQDLNNGLVCRS
ncbi:MAG: hypothetical protein JXR73_14185 [Candidatus Omnitrophica bacterium]|nr:hypothetical protein [Candidatus Omnitrophota bacterium]